MKLHEVAAAVGGRIAGDGEREVTRVASLTAAGPQDLTFLQDAKLASRAVASAAGGLIVGEAAVAVLEGKALIVTRNPRLAFAKAGALLARRHAPPAAIHSSAVIDPAAMLGKDVAVGALAFIGPRVKIGRGTTVGPGSIIISDCEIGEDCELVARVTVYPQTKIGDRAVLHAGAVLGSDGFGFVPDQAGRYHKFPQIGRLEIGNDVEIGANAAVDRGALDATVISDGVKLDNLVQIGHNTRLGENVVIAGQSGISGSCVLENNVLLGGQAGIGDHARLEAGVVLGMQAGVASRKVVRGKGAVFWGTPARPLREHLKQLAMLARLAKRDGGA